MLVPTAPKTQTRDFTLVPPAPKPRLRYFAASKKVNLKDNRFVNRRTEKQRIAKEG